MTDSERFGLQIFRLDGSLSVAASSDFHKIILFSPGERSGAIRYSPVERTGISARLGSVLHYVYTNCDNKKISISGSSIEIHVLGMCKKCCLMEDQV